MPTKNVCDAVAFVCNVFAIINTWKYSQPIGRKKRVNGQESISIEIHIQFFFLKKQLFRQLWRGCCEFGVHSIKAIWYDVIEYVWVCVLIVHLYICNLSMERVAPSSCLPYGFIDLLRSLWASYKHPNNLTSNNLIQYECYATLYTQYAIASVYTHTYGNVILCEHELRYNKWWWYT